MTMPATGFDSVAVVASFVHYLEREETRAGRNDFTALLDAHLSDPGFRSDMDDLLREGIDYDPVEAGELVKSTLLCRLPD